MIANEGNILPSSGYLQGKKTDLDFSRSQMINSLRQSLLATKEKPAAGEICILLLEQNVSLKGQNKCF